MQIWIILLMALTAVLIVSRYRQKQDKELLTAKVREQGGEVISLRRMRKEHPFPDTGRGWWAWRIDWRTPAGDHTSWALTTRVGLKEWRD